MSPTELEELKHWLKMNADILRKYDDYDSFWWMAKLAGFSADSCARLLPEAFIDIQTRTTYKIREDWHIKRELDYFKLDTDESWHRLMRYDNGLDA